MTPSVSQSSGCLRRMLRSARPIPSFPCSSSMSRSCELLLFTMIGPILRRNIPSLYIGCTLEVSLVRRITDLSWKVDDIRCGIYDMRYEVWEAGVVPFTRKSMLCYKHKQNRSSTGSHIQVVKMLKHWLQKIPLSNHSIGLSGQSNLLAKLFKAFHSILYCQVYIKLLRHLWQGMLDS